MMENMKVRTALAEDLEVLLEFEQKIIEAERPFDSTIKDGEIHYYDLRQLIESPHAEVMVVEINQILIGSGYAVIKTRKSTWNTVDTLIWDLCMSNLNTEKKALIRLF